MLQPQHVDGLTRVVPLVFVVRCRFFVTADAFVFVGLSRPTDQIGAESLFCGKACVHQPSELTCGIK